MNSEDLTTIEYQGGCEKDQPKVDPKGRPVGTSKSKDTTRRLVSRTVDYGRQPEGRIENLGKVEKDFRQAAPKEKQVGKTCASNERERTSQRAQRVSWVQLCRRFIFCSNLTIASRIPVNSV